MYSKFPFSMENIPRQRGFACLSLKIGCIFSGLIIILYSVLAIAQCAAAVTELGTHAIPDTTSLVFTYGFVLLVGAIHLVTLFLSVVMLVGALREKPKFIKPWVIWMSIVVLAYLMLFVFWTTTNMINHMNETSLLVYVIDVLGLLIRFYMLMLVASYYKQLDEEGGERLKTLLSNESWYGP